MGYEFYKSCPDFHTRREVENLHNMIDNAEDAEWEDFVALVPEQSVAETFPLYSYNGEEYSSHTGEQTCPFHIKDDFAVRFHTSTLKVGKKVYPAAYIRWSAMEYIWVDWDTEAPEK